MPDSNYDVAIIGSGIAGSMLGAILARHGLRVVIFEAKSHPRFSIGESMILETSEMMRALAYYFDVPELDHFSSENFLPEVGTSHGVKRHFGFMYHNEGRPHDPRQTLQAIIPKEPHGHELHLYRQDTDYFFMITAVKYGATVLQNSPVSEVAITADGVEITTAGEKINASYIVDAGGFRSIIAQNFGLRTHDQLTHSRALFTHMINVAPADGGVPDLPFPMSEGTLHHVFDGGWLWVIPFNNHPHTTNPLVSVGLLLDPRRHPAPRDLTPAAEFAAFIERFPTIAPQFKDAVAVRPWTSTGRIQYGAGQIVGDRWALLGHAAGFIDPLYSKGLYISLAATFSLAHLLLQAQQTGDYGAAAFAPLETMTQRYLAMNDRLIAYSFKSWGNYRLWQLYSVVWLLGAYTEYLRLTGLRSMAGRDRDAYFAQLTQLQLAGGNFDEFNREIARVDALMAGLEMSDPAAVEAAAAGITAILDRLDWMPLPFRAIMAGKTSLPKNKLRLGLLTGDNTFMGTGAYRAHFFADHSLVELGQSYLHEKLRYGRRGVKTHLRSMYDSGNNHDRKTGK